MTRTGSGPLDSTAKRFGTVSFANSGAPAAQPSFLRGLGITAQFRIPRRRDRLSRSTGARSRVRHGLLGRGNDVQPGVFRARTSVAARAALARLGATPAERLAKAKTQRKKDYLRTVDALYFAPRSKTGRDSAYADEAGRLARRYPADVDAQLFHALALLSLFPRTDSTYVRAAGIAEKVMRDHPQHPGALHYVPFTPTTTPPTHAEDTSRARVLEGCSRCVARAAYDISYLRRPRHVGRRRRGERGGDSYCREIQRDSGGGRGRLRTWWDLAALRVFAAGQARGRSGVVRGVPRSKRTIDECRERLR